MNPLLNVWGVSNTSASIYLGGCNLEIGFIRGQDRNVRERRDTSQYFICCSHIFWDQIDGHWPFEKGKVGLRACSSRNIIDL